MPSTSLKVRTKTFNLQEKKQKPSSRKQEQKPSTSKIKNKSLQSPSYLNK